MPRYGQEGTSTGAANMDVDKDPQGHTTPYGIPFYEGYTTTTSRGAPTRDPPAGVHTENFYIPLYTESQTIDHSDHTPTHTKPAEDAQTAAGATAASSEAEAAASPAKAEAETAAAAKADATTALAAKAKKRAAAAAAEKVAAAAIAIETKAAAATAAAVAAAASEADAREAAARAARTEKTATYAEGGNADSPHPAQNEDHN